MAKKILIADDQYTIRELIDLSLGDDYEYLKAEDGEQAIKLAKEMPDLIILDIMMPKVDGFEVCRKIKHNPVTSDIPVIILTAKHGEEDLKKAIECGADEYITKPFEPEILIQSVDAVFSGKKRKPKMMKAGKSIHYIR